MKQPHIRKAFNKRRNEEKNKNYQKQYNNKNENIKLEASQMYSTFHQYISRLNMIMKFCDDASQKKETIISKMIFKNPSKTMNFILKNKKKLTENTMHNLLSVLLIIIKCSRYLAKKIEDFQLETDKKKISKTWKISHCEIMLQNRKAYDIFSNIIYNINKSLKIKRNSNIIPQKALNNYVSLNDIKQKYFDIRNEIKNIKEILNNYTLNKLKKIANEITLLSILVYLPPKRADYGNIEIFISKNVYNSIKLHNSSNINIKALNKNIININHIDKEFRKKLNNYAILDLDPKKSYILFRKYKTAQHHQTLKEYLHPQLLNDILSSLYIYPRTFLFIQNRGSVLDNIPYINNNSYTQFFLRTFNKLFNKRVGCSMFRHIFITEKIDPRKMSLQKQHEYADRMLHSHKEQMQYRWNNIS